MKKVSKKEIRKSLVNAMDLALATFNIAKPSKKIKKIVKRTSDEIGDEIKRALKKKKKRDGKIVAESRKNGKNKVA